MMELKLEFLCIGVIVLFFAMVFISNMTDDYIDYATCHVELDSDKIIVVEGSIERGEWVYAGSNKLTGEKGFNVTYPSLKPKLKFNINNVEWDSELRYDVDSLRDKLNYGQLTAKIRLFDANGELKDTYETDAKVKGDYVIVNSKVGGKSKIFNESYGYPDVDLNYSDITYGTLEVDVKHLGSHRNGDENYGVVIISNRFEV